MIACLSNIMDEELITIDTYDGLCKAGRLMDEKKINFLPVLNENKLVGILTSSDMRRAHPNRITADAMTKNIITAKPETSLWEAQTLLEKYFLKELLIVENEKLVGVVTEARLYGELGKHIDLLTGLYKKDYVYYHGAKLLDKNKYISLIFIDLDKFGQIDKDYGHMLGDHVLKETGRFLKKTMHSDTYVCRFGGDEFIVLTPFDLEKCKHLAKNILDGISSHSYSDSINLTASIGIVGGKMNKSTWNSSKHMISELINLASLASTKAKTHIEKLVVTSDFCDTEIA